MEKDQMLENSAADGEASMKEMREMWLEAARAFETICGKSLREGEVKSFDGLQSKIESSCKASYGIDAEENDKWDKAKSVGLTSLKFLKMLLGAANQASSLIPIPAAAANITTTALGFVFDIPQAIKGYNDAINQVFGEVSSALSQFHIYRSMDKVEPLLLEKIQLVLISFVRICAHVVKYRQARKHDRVWRQIKSIFADDSGLADEMSKFKQALQQQRDVEGTVTLAVVVKTEQNVAELLEKFVAFDNRFAETHLAVQDTQKGVQSLKDNADRIKTLINIRDTLGVPSTVQLNSNTTQTCTSILNRCLVGTGAWIWKHHAYVSWTAPREKNMDTSHVLLVSGPPSSGKTSATTLITKELEGKKGRTYVAHYFFPSGAKKSEDENSLVSSALKYMAFQIARVDGVVQKALGRACDLQPSPFRRSATSDNLGDLYALWRELKIGTSASGATYYLVFDGLENLHNKQAKMLLEFVFGPALTEEAAGLVRVLVSGTDDTLAARWHVRDASASPLRIRMEEENLPDMRLVVDFALNDRGMLQNAKPRSDQQQARNKIIEKLPQNVKGSYSRLLFGLDDVMRLLSRRTAAQELDRMLDQSISSHEAAIKNLQWSLTADEIGELNELLKWVLYNKEDRLSLDQLEAVMFLFSGTESLASMQYIIKNKYSAVLKLDDDFVRGQDGVKEYLQKKGTGLPSPSRDRGTISMTVTINQVDQERCGNFLWDLADIGIRDKFRFQFDSNPSNAQGAIAVDEFGAHHTIVKRAFQYLNKDPSRQTQAIGGYVVCWLPYHLNRLRQLEDDKKEALTRSEQLEIGQSLYELCRDDVVFRRHKASFEQTYWTVDEMNDVREWVMDSTILRELDQTWRGEMRSAKSPTEGYLKWFVRMVVLGLLRERSWEAGSAYDWIEGFMDADKKKLQQPSTTSPAPATAHDAGSAAGSGAGSTSWTREIDWDEVSNWCQGILGLSDLGLDSLWYERFAEASTSRRSSSEVILSLYQRAIEKENPSWLCFRGLGTTHFGEGRMEDAITQVELALKEAMREGAKPKPEAKDIAELHLLCGQYALRAGRAHKAVEHYTIACQTDDAELARGAELGRLKATLSLPDAEETKQRLKSTLAQEGGEASMAGVLKLLAQDFDHDNLVAQMFTVTKADPDLLNEIARAMQMATAMPAAGRDRTSDTSEEDERFVEDEARGVLLYDLGVAAYKYKVSPDGTEPVSAALRLWTDSYKKLGNVGWGNAFITQRNASAALAKHYFESCLDGQHQNHVGALTELAKSDCGIYSSDAAGLLGALHALRGDKERAREELREKVKFALQVLSDATPENDTLGYIIMFKTLEWYQDFKNAVVALAMFRQPDLVTDALRFEAGDVVTEEDDDHEYKQRVLEMAAKLARETIQVAKVQVPDATQQVQRIEAAKAHVYSLIVDAAANFTTQQPEAENLAEKSPTDDGDAKPSAVPDLVTAHAYQMVCGRLGDLVPRHTPILSCHGRTAGGKPCPNEADFDTEFYHCIYCANQDFCGDCLAQLRDPASEVEIMECSPKHKWLWIPPQGSDFYLGPRSKSVRVPSSVRAAAEDGDEKIMRAYFDDNDGGEEISLEAWKERLAVEWGISLEEIKSGNESQSPRLAPF